MEQEAFKLLCADGDGTLYDTRRHVTDVLMTSLEDLGVTVTADQAHNAIAEGLGLHEAFKGLAPDLDPLSLEERFYHFDTKLGHENIEPYDGLFDMLASLRGRKTEIAITSNRTRESVLKILAHLGIGGQVGIYDDMIFTPTADIRPKPAPDQILAAAKKSNSELSEVVVIGDSAGDIKAGKAAGTKATIGFTEGFGSVESLKKAGADYMVSNLWQVSKTLIYLAARS